MTKLEKIIYQLCPDGVEYKQIGDVVDYEQPSKYLVKSTDYNDEYETPVLTAGQTFILGYTDETDGIYQASADNPVIIFDDFTGAFKWVDFYFKAKSSAMKMLKAKKDSVYLRYIFHVMGNIGYSSDEHKRLWIGIYSNISIPVPPLEVQAEIVRILDTFTELTTELATELTNRKKQFEYYRDNLLELNNEVEHIELREIAEFKTGSKPDIVFETKEQGDFEYINAGTTNSGYVTEYNCEGDTVTTPSRGQGGIGFVGYQSKAFWLGPLCYKIRGKDSEKINNKYLYYCLSKQRNDIISRKKEGGVPALNAFDLATITIPVPSLQIQNRIVNVLDYFEAICSDLNIGLPAEIEARQKQYEYYRDKLLTFNCK